LIWESRQSRLHGRAHMPKTRLKSLINTKSGQRGRGGASHEGTAGVCVRVCARACVCVCVCVRVRVCACVCVFRVVSGRRRGCSWKRLAALNHLVVWWTPRHHSLNPARGRNVCDVTSSILNHCTIHLCVHARCPLQPTGV